jgi:hypothetical protein
VLDTFIRQTDALLDIVIDGEVISTTAEHPFWVPNIGWVAAEDLVVGSLVQTEDGRILDVDKIDTREGYFTVYNFSVDVFHSYFVSELGIIVHNTNCQAIDPKDLLQTQTPVEMTGSKIKRLSKKMKDGFDPAYPIEVVDVDGKLLVKDGNHRRAAAIARGIKEVPYVKVEVSPEELEALLIGAANNLTFKKY